jgi:hypothetical protein
MGFVYFYLGFVWWWVFFSYAFIKPRNFFITKNLIITYKLSTIQSFYFKKRDFVTILVFLGFCHRLGKIAKEEEKIRKN